MLIDTHTHIFPEKLKGKVLPKLSEISDCKYYIDGTLENLQDEMKKTGCDISVCLHIATNPKQESSVNTFAIETNKDNIISFGSVHPLSPKALDEIDRLHGAGIKGLKFHPDYQDFMVDCKEMEQIYTKCEKLGLITVFHSGKDPYSPQLVHCPPKLLAEVAIKYPNMKIIAAHMGGMEMADECLSYLAERKNVYIDTSFSTRHLNRETMLKIINTFGEDRVLFATDSPWSTVERELEMIESLDIKQEIKEKIYFKNACILLGIS